MYIYYACIHTQKHLHVSGCILNKCIFNGADHFLKDGNGRQRRKEGSRLQGRKEGPARGRKEIALTSAASLRGIANRIDSSLKTSILILTLLPVRKGEEVRGG
jgi:hypothetical protein